MFDFENFLSALAPKFERTKWENNQEKRILSSETILVHFIVAQSAYSQSGP